MTFYLSKDNQQLGPYSVEQLRTFLQQGLVSDSDQVWAQGWPAWMQIRQVPGLTPEQKASSQVARSAATSSRKPPLWEFIAAILSLLTVWGGAICIPALLLGLFGLHPALSFSYIGEYLFLLYTSGWVLGTAIFNLVVPYLKYRYRSRPSSISPSYAGWQRPSIATIASMTIGTLILVTVLGLGVVTAVNAASSPKQAILAVLKQHYRLDNDYTAQHANTGFQSNEAIDRYAQLTANLASRLQALDISGCPQDFQTIYNQDRSSWSSLAEVLAKHPHINTMDEGMAAGFNRGVVGIAQDQANWENWVDSYDSSIASLHNSSDAVTVVATKYGIKWEEVTGE